MVPCSDKKHTGTNLSGIVAQQLEILDIKSSDVLCVTRDGAPNIKVMASKLGLNSLEKWFPHESSSRTYLLNGEGNGLRWKLYTLRCSNLIRFFSLELELLSLKYP
uniref:GCV_T domain-containing protein n=1 Tax=Steinernema glaseri TaxID=37863 RepID=A0A1I7YHL7_9BILA